MYLACFKQIRTAFIMLILFTVLTGFIYPLIVTGLGQLLFPFQAGGSLIKEHGVTRGSSLLGQSFTQASYFWPRPSHTATFPYNAASSGASNFGLSNPNLLTAIHERLVKYTQADPANKNPIPVELLMGSGSGLDPDISPKAAFYQASRVAKARGISIETVHTIINQHTKNRTLFILGEPRVNVLELNIALDALK